MRLIDRPNRYLALVEFVADRRPRPRVAAHVPNPGRMEELFVPGVTEGYVIPVSREGRRTAFDLVSVWDEDTLVSVDSRVANRLVKKALAAGLLPPWGRTGWKSEPRWEDGRLDFAQWPPGARRPKFLLEVKSSNLRVGDFSLFPDAPTTRGAHHVRMLRDARRRGIRGGILFVLQRPDTQRFRPNTLLDPAFSEALTSAARDGVEVRARRVRVFPDRVEWGDDVPVDLS